MLFLFLLLASLSANAAYLGNADFPACTYWSGAGGSIAQCLNTSKIYDNANAQLLDTTIAAKFNTSAFTDAAVTGKLITGYVSGAGVVAATDTILQAIQKLNGNVNAIIPGTGDVVGPSSAVDNELVLFNGITGKLVKSATLTGIVKATAGVPSVAVAGDFPTLNQSTTGNAATATALAANPTDCGAGTKATAIDASGNLTCSAVSLTADVSGTLAVGSGGTGQTSYTDGQLLIGNSTGNTLAKSTLTAGSGMTITNGSGSITISQTDPTTSAISASDIDWSTLRANGGLYTKTLGANTTFTFSNKAAGDTIVVRLTNTASNYTVTWPTVKWSGGSTPVMTIGAKSDVYTFIYDGTDVFGSVVQNF